MISISPFFTLILGLLIGVGLLYFLLRYKEIQIERVDERTLLIRLPFLGTLDIKEPRRYRGIFG